MDIHSDYSGHNFGKYQLRKKLGNGNFGAVYKAYDKVLKVEKAIKILEVTNPKEAYKLFNEASIPYKCQHNNIIKINDAQLISWGTELLFVVDMNLADGESVESLLSNNRLSVVDSLNIMKDILSAVEYSHIQGIIHRDIKPANIIMDKGVPKLSDFGLASTLNKEVDNPIWYTPHAAPETLVSRTTATVQTDIYALGMTMYRMVNGITDWRNLIFSIPNLDNLIVTGKLIEVLPLKDYVPTKIQKIIKKACHKFPEKRYQSAAEMRNAIERLHPIYNWTILSNDNWKGTALNHPDKILFIEKNRDRIDVIVKNNGRKSTKECKSFTEISEAQKYMTEYIKNTTLQC